MNKVKGVPWEPTPGATNIEVRARFKPEGGPEGDDIKEPVTREQVIRDMYITNRDLQAYGYTPGFSGCIASNRG